MKMIDAQVHIWPQTVTPPSGLHRTRMPCSYRQCVTFFTEELPWLAGNDLEDVMGRGLCAWIGWDYKFQQ